MTPRAQHRSQGPPERAPHLHPSHSHTPSLAAYPNRREEQQPLVMESFDEADLEDVYQQNKAHNHVTHPSHQPQPQSQHRSTQPSPRNPFLPHSHSLTRTHTPYEPAHNRTQGSSFSPAHAAQTRLLGAGLSDFEPAHNQPNEALKALLQGYIVRNILKQKKVKTLVAQVRDTVMLLDSSDLPRDFREVCSSGYIHIYINICIYAYSSLFYSPFLCSVISLHMLLTNQINMSRDIYIYT